MSAVIETLQQKTEDHGRKITDLQENSYQTKRPLLLLATLENRHFRIVAAIIALVILLAAAFVFHEQANRRSEEQNNASLQTDIDGLNSNLRTSGAQLTELDSRVTKLDTLISEMDSRVTGMGDSVQERLNSIDDQAESLDGRVTNLRAPPSAVRQRQRDPWTEVAGKPASGPPRGSYCYGQQ
ncbi:MAG: hypothetical protein JMN24_17550 [gamma proteobacterium endosymbiont of Lamellibrachia anaximandri]|nr:hypothetical protein [gamma proteobacterium endosymbiont of Lamellibrachia anaximandri]MBL3619589.1 hypothetical protein [gamma proteobacterium endosymbiont of Lamellibrachia anaximandri]